VSEIVECAFVALRHPGGATMIIERFGHSRLSGSANEEFSR
jgi:hypothetical protein